MANVPDLLNLLCLDSRQSRSPFGGRHRTILISKDFTNSGDFVFGNLLQHFGRREPNTQILLVTLSHDWTNYSASSAKCGFNLRRSQNMGNIDVLNVMEKFLTNIEDGECGFNYCNYIMEQVYNFIQKHTLYKPGETVTKTIKPVTVMIDDLSILLTIGLQLNEIYRLVLSLDKMLRNRSEDLEPDHNGHLVIQTLFTNLRAKHSKRPNDNNLNHLISNIENICDLCITLKPLDTGHSTRVDGTIKIVDNRLPTRPSPSSKPRPPLQVSTSMFPEMSSDIGSTKAYFFKLGDRRVRLTSSALIF